MNTSHIILARFVTAISLAGFAPAAFAYLDPSTGSMIISAIVGIFATLSFAIKTYWYKLKALFSSKPEVDGDRAERVADQEAEET